MFTFYSYILVYIVDRTWLKGKDIGLKIEKLTCSALVLYVPLAYEKINLYRTILDLHENTCAKQSIITIEDLILIRYFALPVWLRSDFGPQTSKFERQLSMRRRLD